MLIISSLCFEIEFVLASKPYEAVKMYMHQKDWQAAIRVAESSHDHLLVSKVLSAQAEDVAVSGGREVSPAAEKPHVVTDMVKQNINQPRLKHDTRSVYHQIYNPNYYALLL